MTGIAAGILIHTGVILPLLILIIVTMNSL
jgi:hypothetical protein